MKIKPSISVCQRAGSASQVSASRAGACCLLVTSGLPAELCHTKALREYINESYQVKELSRICNTIKFSISLGNSTGCISSSYTPRGGFWSCRETEGRFSCCELADLCEGIRHVKLITTKGITTKCYLDLAHHGKNVQIALPKRQADHNNVIFYVSTKD